MRADIQGLRALAVALVVLGHLGVPGLTGGYLGVDVFFVVSGFLITGLLIREQEQRGRISVPGFYARRARRILPAATLVLAATCLYVGATRSVARVADVVADTRWAALFAANWRFARLGTDYFAAGRAPSPVQHYWSLAVEEQFYVVWPGLLVVVLLLARRRPRTAAWGVVLVAGLVSFGWAVAQLGSSRDTAYFSSFTRAWELAVGAALALATPVVRRLPTRARLPLGLLGLAGVLLAAVTYDDLTRVPGWPALVPVLGTAALLAAGTGVDPTGVGRLLALRPLQWLGDRSYSVYLWHWPVLVLAPAWPSWPGLARSAALVVVIVALSVVGYHFVEQPFRTGRVPWVSRRRALVLWPASLALVLGATATSASLAQSALDRSRAAAAEYYRHHPATPVPTQTGTAGPDIAAELGQAVRDARDGAPVPPELSGVDLTSERWEPVFCHAGFNRARHELCPIGDPTSKVTIVALGDSHMGQWLAALDEDGKQRHYRVVPLVKFGCPPYDAPIRWGRGEYDGCTTFRAWTERQIHRLRPAVVVVGQIIDYRKVVADSTDQAAAAVATGEESLLRRLVAEVLRVVVLSDLSERGGEPADCLSDPHSDLADCMIQQGGDAVRGNADIERAAARTGATYVDLTPLVCADGWCPLVAGGRTVYADYGHVTVDWARHVSAAFGQLLGLAPEASPRGPTLADDLRAALVLADERAPIPAELDNLGHLNRDRWEEHYCHSGGAHTDHRLCPLGDLSSERLLVSFGDSHLGQWLPALDRAGAIAGYRVMPFVKGGCPPWDVEVLTGGVEFSQCPVFRAWALSQITALHPDVIVVAARSDLARVSPRDGLSAPDYWARGVSSELQRLSRLAPEVLVLADTTDPQFEPADCLTTSHADLGDCAFGMSDEVIDANATLRRLTIAEGARYVDVVPLVCLGGRCPMVVDHLVIYADFGHLSMSWARRVSTEFTTRMHLPS